MEVATSTQGQVTELELREAEQGLLRLLHAKRFPREWIETHVPEVMAHAQADFAVRLAAGREDDTVNLLVVIAYRRALKVLRSQKSRPATTSIETLFHLPDESTPTPEQETLDRDRQERIVKAMSHLQDRERKLLALVYFEEMSVREAGRRLGWGKSSADRHHQAALARLRALVGDRRLLGIEVAIPAYVAAGSGSPLRAIQLWGEGAAESAREGALAVIGRAGPVAETGNAAAMSGAGRATAGVCGAAVAACLAATTSGLVGPGVGAAGLGGEDVQRALQPGAEAATRALADRLPPQPVPIAPDPEAEGSGPAQDGQQEARAPESVSRSRGRARAGTDVEIQRRYTQKTINEFGIEGERIEDTDAAESPSPKPKAAARPVSEPSVAARPAVRSSGTAPSSQSGSASSEFGL